MLIVPFKGQNLPQQTVQSIKEQIKQYFQKGPGKECSLHSVYFQNLYLRIFYLTDLARILFTTYFFL